MGKTKEARSERGGAKRRRTVLFQDGLGALSVAAFLFLGATIREVNLLLALGAFFAGFAVLDYWQGRRSLRRLRVARRLPDAIFAGEPFDVEIEIDATQRRSTAWGIAVEDEWARQEGDRELFAAAKRGETEKTGEISGKDKENGKRKKRGKREKGKKEKRRKKREEAANSETAQEEARPNVAATTRPVAYFPRVKGGERRRERYGGVVARRGVRRLATLTASTRFPLGFFRSSERFDAPEEVLVFPKIGVLTDRWNAAFGGSRRETTASSARTSRIAGETATVRDWRPDDSKRTIHWRATAKRDKLQARDFEKRENSVKILILDLFFDEKNASEAARRSRLVEKAVSLAATLIDRWTRSNDAKFLLAINGDDLAVLKGSVARDGLGKTGDLGDLVGRVDSGSGAFRRALTRLATVEAPRRDRLAEIASTLDPRVWANAQVFLVSVAPLAGERLSGNERMERIEKTGKTGEAVAAASGRGIGGRWRDAKSIDVSATDFDDYFEC